MKFTLVNVDYVKDGLVYGVWMQGFTGSLDQATECAIETEKTNSNRITVAVVEDKCYPSFGYIYGAKRLDIREKEVINENKSNDNRLSEKIRFAESCVTTQDNVNEKNNTYER